MFHIFTFILSRFFIRFTGPLKGEQPQNSLEVAKIWGVQVSIIRRETLKLTQKKSVYLVDRKQGNSTTHLPLSRVVIVTGIDTCPSPWTLNASTFTWYLVLGLNEDMKHDLFSFPSTMRGLSIPWLRGRYRTLNPLKKILSSS